MAVPLPGGMDMVRLIRRAAVVLWWIACCVPSANGVPREYSLTASSLEAEATGCSNCRLTITDPTMSGSINLRFIKLENDPFYSESSHEYTFTEGCDGTGQQTTLYASSFLKSPFNPEASVEYQFHESCITLEVTSTEGFRIQYRAIEYPAQDIMLVVDSSNAIQAVDLLSVTAFTSQPSVINGVDRSRGDISAVAFYPPTMTLVIAYRVEGVISRYQVTDWNQSISFIDDIVTNADEVSSVVIDPDNGELYWSDAGRGTIHSSELDGLSPKIVLTQLRSPTDLILDHHGRYLYWIEVDDNNDRILRRATTDGKGGQNCPIGADLIALSDQDSKLHWLRASEDAIGEYSWEDDDFCVRTLTFDELGHQSNDIRNLAMRENILMWTERSFIYGKALGDDTLHPYDLGTPVKLLLLSKFTEQPSAVTEPITTSRSTTARSVTQTGISVEMSTSSDGTTPDDASLTSLYKYIVLVTAVGIVLCALVIVVLLIFSKKSHERTISPKVRRTPELAPMSRNTSDSSENASV